MRVAIIADSHFDQGSRFDECQRIHRWIARDLAERGVDLILHAGDVFERKSTPAERNAVADWIEDLAETAPVVIARGNHDALGDLAIFGELKTKHPVTVEEGVGCYLVAGAVVGCLAWPRKSSLLAATGDTGLEAGEQSARDALQAVLRGLGQRMEQHDGPRILLTHAMVRGSKTSTGQPLVGCDMEIGLEDLALAGADLYALGHVHMPNDWTINDAPVIYPGSPRRTAFGEVEQKGYVLAAIEGHRVTWERIATPATPMLLVGATWDPATSSLVTTNAAEWKWDDLDGAEVRLRYAVDAEHRDAAAAVARDRVEAFTLGGAVSVKVEEQVRPKSTARAPEVATATTLGEKLGAYWTARGEVPDANDRDRLRGRVAALEAEAGHVGPTAARGGLRLERLRVRGLLAFPGEAELDLTKLSPDQRLVAITGGNGQGKSTLLNAWPCSMWRSGPNVSNLADIATARDAVIEATVVNGERWTITQMIDAVSRNGETLIVDGNGAPALDSTKRTAADKWIAEHLPAAPVFFASQFASQREQGVSGQKTGDRKAVLLRTLGIDHYEALAKAAGERVREAKARLATAEARLSDEKGRARDPEFAESDLVLSRSCAAGLDEAVARERLELADAEAAAADATALLRDHERKRLEAADLRRRATETDAKATAEEGRVAEIEKRITNNRAVIARADEINAAVERDAFLTNERMVCAAFIAERKAMLDGARAEVRQAEADAAKARADLAAAQESARRLEKVLADRGAVIAAVANLPGAQRRVAELEAQVAAAETELEAARGKTLATAEGRIEGLRGGLEAIARDDANASLVAGRTLAADDQAVKAAAEVPAEIRRLTEQRAALTRELATTRGIVTEYERAASRAGEMERAAADLETARQEAGSAERAVPAATTVLEAARRAADEIAAQIAWNEKRAKAITAERARLAETVKLAAPLAQAQARLEEVAPQAEAGRAAVAGLRQEAEGLRAKAAETDPGEAPTAPDLDAARARVAAAERAARDAHAAVAVAERQLEDARQAAVRVAALEADRDGIFAELADWTRLARDLGREGLQAVEIGNAGPELSELASDLLHACYGPRFTMTVQTTRTGADGRELEGLEIVVLDTVKGTEKPIEAHSGGEVTILDEAYAWALSMIACRRSGSRGVTVCRDEFGAALDAENGPAWIAMMRRAADLIEADRVLFITHDPALQALADARVEVQAGRVALR